MSKEKDSKKRLFIGLITGTSILLCFFLAMLWYVPFAGLDSFGAWAAWAWGIFIFALIVIVGWAYAGLLANVVLGRTLPFFQKARGLTVKIFLPLMTILGRVFGLSKRKIRGSFIKVNNELVLSESGRFDPEKIMILTPHCLQASRCDMRLTYDVDNCKRCGLCTVKGLLELRDKYGVHFAIATGGTIARRLVVQKRPRMIVAIACERDLASGIQDTYPLPVYGVLNERPHGPCLDTEVSLVAVEEALRRFIKEDKLPADADKNVGMTPLTGL